MSWDATTIVAATTAVNATIGGLIAAYIKLRQGKVAEQRYDTSQVLEARKELEGELRRRIEALETALKDLQAASALERAASYRLLAEERAAHAQCKIEQTELKGLMGIQAERLNTMQEQLNALLRHERVQIKNVEVIENAIREHHQNAEIPTTPIEPVKP